MTYLTLGLNPGIGVTTNNLVTYVTLSNNLMQWNLTLLGAVR